jgi:hypothetical protein
MYTSSLVGTTAQSKWATGKKSPPTATVGVEVKTRSTAAAAANARQAVVLPNNLGLLPRRRGLLEGPEAERTIISSPHGARGNGFGSPCDHPQRWVDSTWRTSRILPRSPSPRPWRRWRPNQPKRMRPGPHEYARVDLRTRRGGMQRRRYPLTKQPDSPSDQYSISATAEAKDNAYVNLDSLARFGTQVGQPLADESFRRATGGMFLINNWVADRLVA